RGIIADLRSETSGSLVSSLSAAIGDLTAPPDIEIDVHERRRPRAIAMRQILAIMTESVRNAYRHADAQSVRVSGTVDRDRVDIEVRDDGKGFDPADLPEGHYGVLGMRERADRIGANVDIVSGPRGTTVRLAWKEKQ
ncbi:MAG: sensor histidine kinase, partial [Acidimicrobiia bacterium]